MVDFYLIELVLLIALPPVVIVLIKPLRNRVFGWAMHKDYFKYAIIDSARNIKWFKISIDRFKVMGKYVMFYHGKDSYFVMKEGNLRNSGIPSAIYDEHNPFPHSLKFDEQSGLEKNTISGSETKEAINSKVVFDLLRFTLSNVETLVMIVLIANLIVGIVGIFFSYQTQSAVNAQDVLLKQVVKYLFPNSNVG